MEPNEGDGSYVDIYMEGQSEGWVAIGFTETPDMVSYVCVSMVIYVDLSPELNVSAGRGRDGAGDFCCIVSHNIYTSWSSNPDSIHF